MQAAIGCAQLEKLDSIVETRRRNFDYLKKGLEGTKGLLLPKAQKNSNPSWFGFLISVKKDAGFTRNELAHYLENKKIQTRALFAGNLLKHPAFDEMRKTGEGYRIAGDLKVTDFVMNHTLWVGVYPGITTEMADYIVSTIKEFVSSK
ncbi:GDP-4-keto-6-deoxy-D-mannose-3-dehydratase / pyridoxamine-phosphate transaminase [termite gut metagenome]|uniref:GDP-4-keto-6-deoxy-D-mannose-3-dehydratase / pyridoxamine-phosphate transaminase n=1 Tax=termite gut metagenome TaxID=433724 RepID=A0A5J4QBY3_9ZZZZ